MRIYRTILILMTASLVLFLTGCKNPLSKCSGKQMSCANGQCDQNSGCEEGACEDSTCPDGECPQDEGRQELVEETSLNSEIMTTSHSEEVAQEAEIPEIVEVRDEDLGTPEDPELLLQASLEYAGDSGGFGEDESYGSEQNPEGIQPDFGDLL